MKHARHACCSRVTKDKGIGNTYTAHLWSMSFVKEKRRPDVFKKRVVAFATMTIELLSFRCYLKGGRGFCHDDKSVFQNGRFRLGGRNRMANNAYEGL